MPVYIALLRAVNVGGTGKLAMTELREMCEALGFTHVRTYIASGNVVFESKLAEASVKKKLEAQLEAFAGKPVGILVRTASELAAILKANPFSDTAPDRTVAIFLDTKPPADALDNASGVQSEVIALGAREIYVHYPDGIGRSKLKIAAAKNGTARNLNTLTKLLEMAGA